MLVYNANPYWVRKEKKAILVQYTFVPHEYIRFTYIKPKTFPNILTQYLEDKEVTAIWRVKRKSWWKVILRKIDNYLKPFNAP